MKAFSFLAVVLGWRLITHSSQKELSENTFIETVDVEKNVFISVVSNSEDFLFLKTNSEDVLVDVHYLDWHGSILLPNL